ncbi:hypothetical protein D3C78_1898570 [compost metagenome]
MIIDAYFVLAGTLVVGLVIAFGGDYENTGSNWLAHACPEAVSGHSCFLPPPGGWPVTLP